ncbi:hypothetical protein H5410_040611 [Solanum commersonii]|uniref:Zinc knuckle family protein n=1 Tax=Solanum commersonii TaxID=4109 RepID=A0A9J5XPE9_SOLCO|nr:hypothetical protein H5410_040611 [Solanum commersonii]
MLKFWASILALLIKKLDDLTILIKDIKGDVAKANPVITTDIASTSERKPTVVSTHVQRPLEVSDFKSGSLKNLEELLVKKFFDLDIKEIIDRKLFGLNFKPIDLSQDFTNKIETIGDFKNQVSHLLPLNDEARGRAFGLRKEVNHSCSSNADLRGWWDNYLNMEEKASIINAVATDKGIDNLGMALVKNREDIAYTLVLTILEYFNGRFTNQHETVRTLLNGLRCQTLEYFRWYKDTYFSKVMELSENKVEYWKAKFIDGLPPLFAERVRKALRGGHGEIPYKDLTYGKNIETCTQEGLNLCNELKMARQLKMDKLKEKSQLGDFCAQFGLPNPVAKNGNNDKHYKSSRTEGSHRKRRSRHRSKEECKARKSYRKSHRFTKDRS